MLPNTNNYPSNKLTAHKNDNHDPLWQYQDLKYIFGTVFNKDGHRQVIIVISWGIGTRYIKPSFEDKNNIFLCIACNNQVSTYEMLSIVLWAESSQILNCNTKWTHHGVLIILELIINLS